MERIEIPELVVATSNKKKFLTLKKLIRATGVSVRVSKLEINIIPPKEQGNTPIHNALIKNRYYSKFTDKNLLTMDDALYIKHARKSKRVETKIKSPNGKEITDREIFEYWWGELKEKVLVAKRVRSVVVYTNDNKYYKTNLILNVTLMRPFNKPKVIKDKPLNYFMYPVGSKVPIYRLSETQKITMQKDSVNKLNRILIKLS